ncbi:MAG TPA: PadR family transcriptional regulator [Caulobacteraceae bacterium]|jgi:DNA-binding PadR family transcriptional regulator|nr:PadR family transcriptional regulator [Caulobacteraceae bacterium]
MHGWKDEAGRRGRHPHDHHDPEDHHCAGRGGWGRGGRHRWGRGGFERGFGGRMFGPGDLRLVIMALIEEKPRHGYDLIKAVEQAFGGAYAPSPGAVYPTLALLEDEGLLVSSADESGKRIYSLTDAGKNWLTENRVAVDGVMERMRMAGRAMSGQATPDTVRETLRTLQQAVQMKPGDWSLEEEARVVEILMNAAREISRQS